MDNAVMGDGVPPTTERMPGVGRRRSSRRLMVPLLERGSSHAWLASTAPRRETSFSRTLTVTQACAQCPCDTRQMLSGYHHHPSSSMHIPENMAKGARNMALLFTLLGAAYRVHQGGSVDGGVVSMTHGGGMMPDPSAVLSEENVEALKNVMIKVGLAGGFLKAGMTTMKEKKGRDGCERRHHDGRGAS